MPRYVSLIYKAHVSVISEIFKLSFLHILEILSLADIVILYLLHGICQSLVHQTLLLANYFVLFI